jgi:hypothetical protein
MEVYEEKTLFNDISSINGFLGDVVFWLRK